MYINLSDQIVSQFLSGLITVVALIGVGGVLAIILHGLERRFPFMRLALVLALSPLALIKFFDQGGHIIFYVYAMLVIILGFAIDGTQYLLNSKAHPKSETKDIEPEEKEEASPVESDSGVIVWEKAE